MHVQSMVTSIPQSIEKRYEKLKASINQYRHDFHVENKETISPEALDSLKDELVQLEAKYPQIITSDSPSQRVAGEPLAAFSKVQHKVPQWSLNDAFEALEFESGVELELSLDEQPVVDFEVLEEDANPPPQIILFAGGEVTPGEMTWIDDRTGDLLYILRWDLFGRMVFLPRGLELDETAEGRSFD